MSTNPIVQQWQVTSTTDASKSYTVSKRLDGSYSCACPAWKFHKAPKPACKHITALRVENIFATNRRVDDAVRQALREQPSTPTPQRAPVAIPSQTETFTVSILQPYKRKIRADL